MLKSLTRFTTSAYGTLMRFLEFLAPVFDLFVRLYMARIFWKAGALKASSWMSTVMLFTNVYQVPYLSPETAALLSTAVELGGSFLLAVGLAERLAAGTLFTLNYVAVVSYPEMSPAGRQEAFYWGILLLFLFFHGPGTLSLDTLFRLWIRRRETKRSRAEKT